MNNLPPPTDKDLRLKIVDIVLSYHRDGKTGADNGRIMKDIQSIYQFITEFTK